MLVDFNFTEDFYECTDGCCSTWDEKVVVTDEERKVIYESGGGYIDTEDMLSKVLKALGFKVTTNKELEM